jgi:hypothetical protein
LIGLPVAEGKKLARSAQAGIAKESSKKIDLPCRVGRPFGDYQGDKRPIPQKALLLLAVLAV